MSACLAAPRSRAPVEPSRPDRPIDLIETVFVGIVTQALVAIPLLCAYAILAA